MINVDYPYSLWVWLSVVVLVVQGPPLGDCTVSFGVVTGASV